MNMMVVLAAVEVILPSDPSLSQQTAAEELREYCGKIGVASGTIELRTDESFGENGYTLETVQGRLVISGSKARGVLNGAYGYLQDVCGVDWLSSWCESVPKHDKLPLPAQKEAHQPSFEVRDSFWRDIIDHQRFGARLRLNKHSFQVPDPKFGPDLNPFDTVLGECHTYKRILDQDVHFKDHPEWFSEVNGKRKDGQTQLCTTNPEVLRRTIDKVLERIAANPSARYFGVDPNDYFFECECAKCKAINDREGTPGGATMVFVNQVAEAVAAKHPDKYVKISVYQYNAVPPKTFRIHRNVFLDLSPIDGGYLYPKATSELEGDVKTRLGMAKWKEISDGEKMMNWDYTMNFHEYLLPFANVPSIQPNLKYWKSLGGTYEFVQGDNKGYHGEFAELKGWLVAQLLWNVDADVPKLIRRFMRGYYGPAAKYVEDYYDFLNAYERSDKNRNKLVKCGDNLENRPELLDDAFLVKASEFWRKAIAAVKDDPAYSYNVRMSSLPIDYLLYCKYAKHVNLTRDPSALTRGLDAAKRLSAHLKEAAAAGREVSISEDTSVDRRVLPRIHAYAAGTRKILGDGNRATIGAKDIFRQGFHEQAHTEERAGSFDGTVMCLNNDNYGWLTSYNLDQVAFDRDCEYAIRVRFRAKATGKPGEVFQIGVCNNADDSYPVKFSVDYKGLKEKDGFAWYEIGSWKPRENEQLYFAPGWFDLKKDKLCPQHDGIEIDCFEIYRK